MDFYYYLGKIMSFRQSKLQQGKITRVLKNDRPQLKGGFYNENYSNLSLCILEHNEGKTR